MKKVLISVLIVTATILCGCGGDKRGGNRSFESSASASSSPPKPIVVEVFEVIPSATPSEQLVPAVVSVEATAQVLAGRDGVITQLEAQEGASVTKGQVLAKQNDDDLRALLRQAELEVERLRVEERQYDAMISVNRSEVEQETALFKEGLTSKRQLDRAQYRVEVAKEELERTRLATHVARAKVDGARIDLERSIARAPINGVVARRYVHLGTSVAKNDKLFEISQAGPFEVKFQLPQAEKGRLGRGSVVNLSLADNNEIVASARIRRVDTTADAASNTIGFLADVIGQTSLITGLAVNVHVPDTGAASAVSIPRTAFSGEGELRSGAARTLFVLTGGRCELRAVRVKTAEGDQVEISAGLSVGDRVVVSPPAGLKPGDVAEVKSP